MSRSPRLLVALFLALGLVLAGCDATVAYAAKVGDGEISIEDLDDELQAIRDNTRYLEDIQAQGAQVLGTARAAFNSDFVARVLTRQILLRLVSDELAERGIEVTDAELQEARDSLVQSLGDDVFGAFPEGYRQTLIRRQAEVAALQAAVSENEVTDQAVRQFYEENEELFARTCVRHILFSPPTEAGQRPTLEPDEDASALIAEALAARQRIVAGEQFESIASQLSDDPGSGAQGGDLGCVAPGEFVPEFEDAMAELDVGELSEPVRTAFGIHLLQVTDRRVEPLEEVEAQIRDRLAQQGQEAFAAFLQEAVAEADIEVNPRYGEFTVAGGSPQIIPPSAPTTTAPGQGSGQVGDTPLIPVEP